MPTTTVATRDLDKRVGVGGELTGLDKQLLKMASKRLTPEQMSEELDGAISPARCAQRTKEILRSQDWLSVVEMQAILMNDLIELKDILFERVREEGGVVTDRHGNETYSFGDPRWSANLTKVLKEFRSIIEDGSKKVDNNLEKIRSAHGRMLISAVELSFRNLLAEIRKEYPEVEESALRDMMETALPAAIDYIDLRTDAE